MYVCTYVSLSYVCVYVHMYMHMCVLCFYVRTYVPTTYIHISLPQALGLDRVVPLHIDTGFMRKEESKNVKKSLETIGVDLRGTYVCIRPDLDSVCTQY